MKKRVLKYACGLIPALVVPSTSFAQEDGEPRFGLDTIVVSAEKREGNLQDTPIAITALGEEESQLLGIQTTADIAIATPGVFVTELIGFAQPYIRGVGNNITQGVENSVATYIDGIYIKNLASTNQNLFALERVEVLRGPQGTLYGRNATGGAMNIITKDPYGEFEGNIQFEAGNFNRYGGAASVNLPISESLGAIVSANYVRRDSYVENLAAGQPGVDDAEDIQINAKIRGELTDRFSATFNFMYLDKTQDEALTSQQSQADATGVQFAVAAMAPNTFTNEPHKAFSDQANRFELEHLLFGLTLDLDLGAFDVKSITSYQTIEQFTHIDFDGTANPLFAFNFNVHTEFNTFSQELQFLSKPDSSLQWIAGLYYFYDDGGFKPVDLDFGAVGNQLLTENNTTEAFAAFAQATIPILDALSLTVGGRYSYEEKVLEEQSAVFVDPMFGTVPLGAIPGPLKADWDDFAPKASLEYRLNDSALAWFTYSQAFKSGGWNPALFPSTANDVVDPEHLEAFEIGIKTDLLDNRLRLNVAAFKYNFSNQQFQITDPGTGAALVVNAASSDIKGVEIEGTGVITDSFSINFGASYLDAEYESFPGAPSVLVGAGDPLNPIFEGAVNLPVLIDASGTPLVNSPEFTFNISPRYAIDVGIGELVLSGIYSWRDDVRFSPDGIASQEGYGILNASAQLTSNDGRWYARLWGQNIGGKDYLVLESVNALGALSTYGAPRTFGGTIGLNF